MPEMATETARTLDPAAIAVIAERFSERPGALMLVLHEVQCRFGFIPPESVAHIAQALNLSRAEVHGVASFYRDFRSTPPGRHTIRICRAESCQAMDAEALAAHIRERLGIDFGETTADAAFTLEPVFCFGNCACSPAIAIDGELHGRVTPAVFDELIASVEKE